MAKSLIISFQYNIESVYFFYSNPVHLSIYGLFTSHDTPESIFIKYMTEIQLQMSLLALSTAGSKSKNRLNKSGELWSVFIFTSKTVRTIFEVSSDILKWGDEI